MQPQVLIRNIHYKLDSGISILNALDLTLAQKRIGLVGRNGSGKSTLLKLISGLLEPSQGFIQVHGKTAYVPQNLTNLQDNSIAAFFDLEEKINSLERIEKGSIELRDYEILQEDWECKLKLINLLQKFDLAGFEYHKRLTQCSGGELTRLLLTKAFTSEADFLLLDEPTNHLDLNARKLLYKAIQLWPRGILIASHDRNLLNYMDEIIELTTLGAKIYGGNFDDYEYQKALELAAHHQELHDANRLLKKNKISIQSSREKHERKQSYGRKLRSSGSIDKLTANSKKGRSERTQSKMLIKEKRMIQDAETKLKTAQQKIENHEVLDVQFPMTQVPKGKFMIEIDNLDFYYTKNNFIFNQFNFKVRGPERIAIIGKNGSGKSTLLKLILGNLIPKNGTIKLGTPYITYIDQFASLLKPNLTIFENFILLNPDATQNEAYRNLAIFLFKNTAVHNQICTLSGGQKVRALLACVLMSKHPPQILILDEPTNHLDIDSVKSIESALKHYEGVILVVSHDQRFLHSIRISNTIYLDEAEFPSTTPPL